MTRREEELNQDRYRDNNEEAMERMDYEGGNQGDYPERNRQDGREQTSHDTGRSQPERSAPGNNSRNEP